MKKSIFLLVFGFHALVLQAQFDPRPVYTAPKAFSKPVIDGIANDTCWDYCPWTCLQYDWLLQSYHKGARDLPPAFSPDDFSGRFKITWDEDLLYILAEITDDTIHDNIADPLKDYWKDDCLEIFIDENASRDFHNNNFSAFAYHMSPVTGNVVDYGNDQKPHLFNNDVEFKVMTTGNTHIWEIAIKIYNDKYVRGGFNISEKLYAGKVMGFSSAYCDDDGGDMDNFIGWVEGGLYSSKYADVFGTLILADNGIVEAIDTYDFDGIFYSRTGNTLYRYTDIETREYAEYRIVNNKSRISYEIREVLNRDAGGFVPEYKICYDYQGDDLYYCSKELYEEGRLMENEECYYKTDGTLADHSLKKEYIRNQEGRIRSLITCEYLLGEYINTSEIKYEYTNKNKLLQRINRIPVNDSWQILSLDSIVYSELEKPERKVCYNLRNGNLQLLSEEFYSYDDYLMPKDIIRNTERGNFKTHFDNTKNQTNAISWFQKVDGDWEIYMKEEMDENYVVSRMIREDEEWVEMSRTEKTLKTGILRDRKVSLKNKENFTLVFLDTIGFQKGLPNVFTKEVYSLYKENLMSGNRKEISYLPANPQHKATQINETMKLTESAISLYPNPANDYLTINIPEGEESVRIRISDMNGKPLIEETHNMPENDLSININELSNGIYFVEVYRGNFLKILKLIKK